MSDTTLIQRLRPLADEYASLMDRWKYACAGSQEVADLHATFKARERVAGKAFESGDIAAILDALEQQAAQIEALRADAERWRHVQHGFAAQSVAIDGMHSWTWRGYHMIGKGANIDEAVDAALRQEQPT